MTQRLYCTLATLLALALPLPAHALCLGCTCEVINTAIAFGAYEPLSGAAVEATGDVSMRCWFTVGALVTYSIDLGKGSYSTSFSPRKMGSGGNRLEYNLYTNGERTSIWGDGVNEGTQHITGSALIALLSWTTVTHTVYGRIPASQITVPPGNYSDAVQVTITYN